MDIKKLAPQNEQEFKAAQNLLDGVFKKNKQLPEQVFNDQFQHFLFEEFASVVAARFWPIFQELCRMSGDTHLLMAVLDPEPVNYYFKHFGSYNWFTLPATFTSDDYWDFLDTAPDKGNSADAILFSSDIVVWVPLSQKWALWGDRDYEVCVLSFAKDSGLDINTPLTGNWQPVDKALDYFIEINFRTTGIPEWFSNLLTHNYPAPSDVSQPEAKSMTKILALLSCMKSLGDDTLMLSPRENEERWDGMHKHMPLTSGGRIQWDKVEKRQKITSLQEIIANEASQEDVVYILWDRVSLPVLKSTLGKVMSRIDKVTAVGFTTLIYNPDKKYVIELYHNGEMAVGFF